MSQKPIVMEQLKQIVQLKKDGIVVSLPLVYQAIRKSASTKTKAVGKKRGPKPRVAVEATSATGAKSAKSATTNELLDALQNFVSAAGSLDKAIAILMIFQK